MHHRIRTIVAAALVVIAISVPAVAQDMPSAYKEVMTFHMLHTQAGVVFLHYWGTGSADTMAAEFRAALDQLGNAQALR